MSLLDTNNDKNEKIISYLKTCPEIAKNPLFFNFAQREDNNQLYATYANSNDVVKKFIDGSRECIYTFTIIVYKSVAYNPLIEGMSDENMEEWIDVQSVADWIEEQNDNNVFPDFGNDCVIDSIETLTNIPTLNNVESDMQPALAQYSLGVRIRYLDNSKVIWNS